MFSAKNKPKALMPSQFRGETNTTRIIAFKNPLCIPVCNDNEIKWKKTAKYANMVKNINDTKPIIVINPVEDNKILPGWVVLTRVNGNTEMKYGFERLGWGLNEYTYTDKPTYDELLDESYCRSQQRYWDNDIKLKGALSVYYCMQTLDEWVKHEEEERRQEQIDDIIEDKRIEKLIKEDKTNSILMDIGMKRIKKNARVMTHDNYDPLDYQYELEN